MQPVETEKQDVGVLVGRFQVHELHAGHRELLDHVVASHDKVIIFLGLSPLSVSTNNPLDFEARKQMLLAEYQDVNVLYIPDRRDDESWSKNLDAQIAYLVTPSQSVILYGGRDSFIDHYRGKYPTQELLQSTHFSGSAQRKAIARSRVKASPEFRAGAIWAAQGRYPTVYPTVDIAILRENRILLGRKPNEHAYRFIGGFADPRSACFEDDARREAHEESGLEVADVRYLGSVTIDDWRYRAEPDCIRTLLFKAKYVYGRPTPGDDIEEVRWFDLSLGGIGPEARSVAGNHADWYTIVPEHRPLMRMLLAHINRKES